MNEQKVLSVKDVYVYENGLCPDCGMEIPGSADEGESCGNCGHVWWIETHTED